MGVIAELLRDVEIPGFYKVRNHMGDTHTEDAAQAVREALKREGTLERIRAGSTVCFSASSHREARPPETICTTNMSPGKTAAPTKAHCV